MSRNIFTVIDRVIEVIKKYDKYTTPIDYEFETLKSSFLFMAPELFNGSEGWGRFMDIMNRNFPLNKYDENDPFIIELQNIIDP